jgi:hypothetical protein
VIKKIILSLLIFLSFVVSADTLVSISDYQPTFFPAYHKNDLVIAIRSYFIKDQLHFLIVNPDTFKMENVAAAQLSTRKPDHAGRYFTRKALNRTPYLRALTKSSLGPYPLENTGIVQACYPIDGQFLTIDLCPSSKPFEAKFFRALVARSEQLHHPIPIAISISGLWLINHPQDFLWLQKQRVNHKLDITWINHSFTHVYYRDLPSANNFLLIRETNFDSEVLTLEKLLLQRGELPSVFFRFPGLISNRKLIHRLCDRFGLIPLGANAWLARHEPIKAGSFILVHGNSNEPAGIAKIMPLLSHLHLYPLSAAFKQP